jgi:membrane protein YqaA with SNARE-associated domain
VAWRRDPGYRARAMSMPKSENAPASGENADSSAPPPAPKDVKFGVMRRLYDWCLKWAATPYGVPMLFVISFAEASFFPIPPDVLLLALCFAVPKKSFRYAFWCLTASVLGGMLGYYIGYSLWASLSHYFIPHVFSQAAFDKAKQLYVDNAFKVIVLKGFTPIPFKLVTISAGVAQVPFGLFVAASVICRSIRFFLVAGLIYKFGERVRPFVEKYLTWLMLAAFVLLVGGFVAIKMFR